MKDLLSIATSVKHLTSTCRICNKEAIYTMTNNEFKKGDFKTLGGNKVPVVTENIYFPACRECAKLLKVPKSAL